MHFTTQLLFFVVYRRIRNSHKFNN